MPTLDHNTCFMQSILINLCVTVSCSPFSFISVLLFLAVHSHSSLCYCFFHFILICFCVAVSFTPFSFVSVLRFLSLHFHSFLCCCYFHSIFIHLCVAFSFTPFSFISMLLAVSFIPFSFISLLPFLAIQSLSSQCCLYGDSCLPLCRHAWAKTSPFTCLPPTQQPCSTSSLVSKQRTCASTSMTNTFLSILGSASMLTS